MTRAGREARSGSTNQPVCVYCMCVSVYVNIHQEQVWRGGRVWTGWHLQHGDCCGTLRFHGNGPPGSSHKWQRCQLGYETSSTALAPEEEGEEPELITHTLTGGRYVNPQTLQVWTIPQKHTFTLILFTWKMAYMTQLRGLLLENSATLNILKLHLSRSSNSCWSNTQTNNYQHFKYKNRKAS